MLETWKFSAASTMTIKKSTTPKAPEVCPVCGKDVPCQSLACPECGADHNSGWREDAETYDAADLPEEDFDYNQFVREEFGAGPKPTTLKTVWWVTAFLVLVVLVALYLALLKSQAPL